MSQLITKAKVLVDKAIVAARPQLNEFWKYAKVELSPPLPADFQKLKQTAETAKNMQGQLKKSGLSQVTVSEVWLNFLVTVEVITWFYMGEVIGRRHFVGYKV